MVRMNVAAHQDKEKNERTGKRKAGDEEDRRPILKRLRAALIAVVQGAARLKNGLCEGNARDS